MLEPNIDVAIVYLSQKKSCCANLAQFVQQWGVQILEWPHHNVSSASAFHLMLWFGSVLKRKSSESHNQIY